MGGQKYSSCIDQITKNAKIVLFAVLFSLSFWVWVLSFNQVLEVKKDATAPGNSSFILIVKDF